jgi:hypothetical protein
MCSATTEVGNIATQPIAVMRPRAVRPRRRGGDIPTAGTTRASLQASIDPDLPDRHVVITVTHSCSRVEEEGAGVAASAIATVALPREGAVAGHRT